jgi:hypothetical protein
VAHPLELEELVEHFTLYPDEIRLLRNKSGATRLGFSLSLKFLLWKARFPRGRGELPDNMVEFVAGQVGVPAADIGLYDWDGRQVKRHRAEIRRVTGFRECSVADAENLTAWLAGHVCCKEQRADRVREELLGQCRWEKIEPPGIHSDTRCGHCGKPPAGPLGQLIDDVTAHPRHRPGRKRTSGRTAAERRSRPTEDATYTITITPSNLPQWQQTP